MNAILANFAGLSGRQRAIAAGAALSVFLAVFAIARLAAQETMALLYAGLDGAAAGEVLTALDQQGASYEVRGTAIYVAATDRDSLRMTLASAGLPANGAQGYELLDSLSGFGTTSQMFDAAYWRAKEGELARTILASPHIRAARVHISAAPERGFGRNAPVSAAVTITAAAGKITQQHVRALQYLVASSVAALSPEEVAVIDSENGLVSEGDPQASDSGDLEETLRRRAMRLLEAHVGAGQAIVEVSIERVTEAETYSESLVDPESRIAISTDVQERAEKSTDARPGSVTVASNLPTGDATGDGGQSSGESTESRTLTNFEVSQTRREVVRQPGAIRKLSVAVLVSDATKDGTPRTEEEIQSLQALVASAVGFEAQRGDSITVRALPFEPLSTDGMIAESSSLPIDVMQLVQVGVLGAVALVLGLFVVRPILLATPAASAEPPLLPADGPEFDIGSNMSMPTMGFPALDDLGGAESDPDAPIARLKRAIEDRREDATRVLQSWVEDTDQVRRT